MTSPSISASGVTDAVKIPHISLFSSMISVSISFFSISLRSMTPSQIDVHSALSERSQSCEQSRHGFPLLWPHHNLALEKFRIGGFVRQYVFRQAFGASGL